MSVSISEVSFEHHREALGIAEASPRISWRFGGNNAPALNWEQTSYDVEITHGTYGIPQVFNKNSSDSVLVPWPTVPLQSAEAASVRVRAHGKFGQPSTPWSDYAAVEPGLLRPADWHGAIPIGADRPTEVKSPKRPIYFRKTFAAEANITNARLYITALGLYEAEINGNRVGDYVLAPGWQSYQHRHVYDTYDVTGLITEGNNAIGITVGEGWYAGRLGFEGGDRNIYGDTLGVLALLVLTQVDGDSIVVPSDTSWRANTGPILSSEIYDGEVYNSSLKLGDWTNPEFNSNGWLRTKELPQPKGKLVPPDGPPVRRLEERAPNKIFQSESGKTVIDFGQNLVGWLRLTVDGPAGTNITLVHTEVMEDGEVATRPLRIAHAADTIYLSGNGPLTWEPKFTFHGFRYVQVTGWPNSTKLNSNSVAAVVIHSDMERTGYFQCSHPLLTKFEENVVWSMKGNFLSIPTDCPQRDERLGWTGDLHAFGPTANFLYDTSGFLRGWQKDLWSEQQDTGKMVPPLVIPIVPAANISLPTAVWGDVAVGNPWNMYNFFGDETMLREQYMSAKAWIDIGIPRNKVGLWDRSTFQLGDWLDPLAPPDSPGSATTPGHLVADAYLIRMTEYLAKMSATLGFVEAAKNYTAQRAKLVSGFHDVWIDRDGNISNMTQTALTLALQFGIYNSSSQRNTAAKALRKIIADNDYLVGTGFAGTSHLGFALSSINATSDFYRMLLQTRVPSWLYQVVLGGTTTWERWDSLLPNGTVNPGEMTSFNHYAFGSVANWIHTYIGGISPMEPGWKKIRVSPIPGGGIDSAEVSYLSRYGKVGCKWWIEKEEPGEKSEGVLRVRRYGLYVQVIIPPNTRAEVTMPGSRTPFEVGSGFHEYFLEDYQVPN